MGSSNTWGTPENLSSMTRRAARQPFTYHMPCSLYLYLCLPSISPTVCSCLPLWHATFLSPPLSLQTVQSLCISLLFLLNLSVRFRRIWRGPGSLRTIGRRPRRSRNADWLQIKPLPPPTPGWGACRLSSRRRAPIGHGAHGGRRTRSPCHWSKIRRNRAP